MVVVDGSELLLFTGDGDEFLLGWTELELVIPLECSETEELLSDIGMSPNCTTFCIVSPLYNDRTCDKSL